MDPTHYTSFEHFINDPSFREWVRQGGFRRPEEPWSQWLVKHPQQQVVADQARKWILAAYLTESQEPDETTQYAVRETLDRIQVHRPGQFRIFVARPWMAAAASICLIGLLGWLLFQYNLRSAKPLITQTVSSAKGTGTTWQEKRNDASHPQLMALSDGSSVMLQPGSRLLFPAQFARDRRTVRLIGEGFFEVAKNKAWPFFVETASLTTRVVGTSFRIREVGAQTTVTVRTGRVWVSARHKPTSRVVLTPNERVVFNAATLSLSRPAAALATEATSPLDKQAFDFSDTPVSTIFASLEQAYGIHIAFDREKLNNCSITTSLNDEPLAEKLHILCEALGGSSRYQLAGNRITITSDGCQ